MELIIILIIRVNKKGKGGFVGGSFLIVFREGLEAFLVIGIILACLSMAGLSRLKKWVYSGATLGLGGAFALAVFFQIFLSGFAGMEWEMYVKTGVMGLAVAVLSYMVIWMGRNAGGVRAGVESKLKEAAGIGNVFAISFMAFLAVLREGFETALFLGAVYGDAMGGNALLGGITGLAGALVVTYMMFGGMKRLPLKLFFRATGAMIIVIAAGILSNMVGLMQETSILPVLTAPLFDIGWLLPDTGEAGMFLKALLGYSSSPSALQALAYTAYVAAAMFLFVKGWRVGGRGGMNA